MMLKKKHISWMCNIFYLKLAFWGPSSIWNWLLSDFVCCKLTWSGLVLAGLAALAVLAAHAAPGRVGSTRKNGEMLEIRRNKHETNQHQSGFFPPKDQKLWPHWSIHQNAEHTLAKLREPNPSQQKTRPPAPIIMNTATQRTSTWDPILNQVFENYWYMI